MTVATLKRTITFDKRTLADVPGHSADQLRLFYARIYPELNTATVEEVTTAKGIEITFTTGYKSKG